MKEAYSLPAISMDRNKGHQDIAYEDKMLEHNGRRKV